MCHARILGGNLKIFKTFQRNFTYFTAQFYKENFLEFQKGEVGFQGSSSKGCLGQVGACSGVIVLKVDHRGTFYFPPLFLLLVLCIYDPCYGRNMLGIGNFAQLDSTLIQICSSRHRQKKYSKWASGRPSFPSYVHSFFSSKPFFAIKSLDLSRRETHKKEQ